MYVCLILLNYNLFCIYFNRYYKDPERTAEAIDSEGWHHTGDVGMWLPNGTLRIIDRRKHIFKLSQGEYIVPEKIENIYTLSQYVNQVFVYGESLKVINLIPYHEIMSEHISLFFYNRVV